MAAISVAVVLGVIVGAVPVTTDAAGTSFTDVKPTFDHYDSILNLAGCGIVRGYSDGPFHPDSRLRRGQASKPETKNVENPGLISGFEDNLFKPKASMTRAQMAPFIVRSENIDVATTPIDEARAKIRKVVTQNGVIEIGSKKVAASKFDSETNTTTMTAYDSGEGIKGITGIGVFSSKLQALGVKKIQLGTAKAVDLSQPTAKDTLKADFFDLLKPSTKPSPPSDVSAEGVQVTLYAVRDGIQFRETFNVNFHVFVSSAK